MILDRRGHPITHKTVWRIYQAQAPDGRAYIGCTTRPVVERWQAHLTQSLCAWANGPLHTAIRDYGRGAFRVTILTEALSAQEAGEKEARYIRDRNTLEPHGLNIKRHGLRGAKMR